MSDTLQVVESRLVAANIKVMNVRERHYPNESIYIVEVDPQDLDRARDVAEALEDSLPDVLITVRKGVPLEKAIGPVKSLSDARVTELVSTLNEYVRAGEDFREFHYIEDASGKVAQAVSQRHHIIFGRRGVGKTALLLEVRRRLSNDLTPVFWKNLKPYSRLDDVGAFLTLSMDMVHEAMSTLQGAGRRTSLFSDFEEIVSEIKTVLAGEKRIQNQFSDSVAPRLNQLFRRFTESLGRPFFLMLDDAHTVRRNVLPLLLDRILMICTDNNLWMKVAGIHHQIRYYMEESKCGLEVPHDAQVIDLDITLEDPERATSFLASILSHNMKQVGISSLSSVFHTNAIDRLVLASGGVPRDFLVLSGRSIQTTSGREGARTVGVQDVNISAGRYYDAKIQELDDDAAAEKGESEKVRFALEALKRRILEGEGFTYFKIDLRAKENQAEAYRLVQSLGDFRTIHILRSSISDEHQAGVRHEVYLIDVALYSGQRLRKKLNTIEFKRGKLVARTTGTSEAGKIGNNARIELSILRRAPVLDVEDLVFSAR